MPIDPVSIRLDPQIIEAMKKEARRQSVELDRDIQWTDLLRRDLESKYLAPSGTIEARLNRSRMQK